MNKRGSRRGGRKAVKKAPQWISLSLKRVMAVAIVAAAIVFAIFGRDSGGVAGSVGNVPTDGTTADDYWLVGNEPPVEQVRLVSDWAERVQTLVKRADGMTPIASEVNDRLNHIAVGFSTPRHTSLLVTDSGIWHYDCQGIPASGQLLVWPQNQFSRSQDWVRVGRAYPTMSPEMGGVVFPAFRLSDALLVSVVIHELGHFIRYQERGCREWDREDGHALEEVEMHQASGELLNRFSDGEMNRLVRYVLDRVPEDADLEQSIATCDDYGLHRLRFLFSDRGSVNELGLITSQVYLSAYFAVIDRRGGGEAEKAAAWSWLAHQEGVVR